MKKKKKPRFKTCNDLIYKLSLIKYTATKGLYLSYKYTWMVVVTWMSVLGLHHEELVPVELSSD